MAKLGFGRNNPFPLKFGSGVCYPMTEMELQQDRLKDGFDPSDTSFSSAYAYAEGSMLGIGWALVRRGGNHFKAKKTIDWLEEFEKILGVKPTSDLSVPKRRGVVAGRLKGFGAITLETLFTMSDEILGRHLVELQLLDPTDVVIYWPPNPGPPGREWMSNRLTIYAKLDRLGSSNTEFANLVTQWEATMNKVIPAYCDFDWFTGDEFVLGESFLGEDAYG